MVELKKANHGVFGEKRMICLFGLKLRMQAQS